MDLMIDFFNGLKQQGPGSEAETALALQLTGMSNLKNLKIADLGCGNGRQTMEIARLTDSQITAVDLFPKFLNSLNARAKNLNLDDRIQSLEHSIEALPFGKETFDIIWSEGAIYNIGFENGIKEWKSFLKPGGCLCVTEITWITGNRPKEIEDFWQREYPEIDTASNKIKQLENNGYTLVAYFTLSENSWLEEYYHPMERTFSSFIKTHGNTEEALNIVESNKREIELYEKYKEFYSYGFYIARKNR